jgi:(p)ppGpp synthase/HD superfamily hydrolase
MMEGEVPMGLSSRFDEAMLFAHDKHRDQVRKGTNIPYISHLLQVAGIVLEYGGNEDQAIAGLLHDVVEDQGVTADDLRTRFGESVAVIVEGCTDTDQINKPLWRPRKEQYIEHVRQASEETRFVSAADKLHNARAILAGYREHGDALFNRFNGGKAGTFWYYRALIDVFRETCTNTALVDELNRVVNEVEALAYR